MSVKPPKRKKKRKKIIKWGKLALIVGALCLVLSTVISSFQASNPITSTLSYTDFWRLVDTEQIKLVEVINSQDTFTVHLNDGTLYKVINPKYEDFKKELLEAGVNIQVRQRTVHESIMSIFLTLPMTVALYVMVIYIVFMTARGNNTLFKVFKPEEIITFNDIAGMSETKKEVQFVIEQLKNTKKLRELGARPCKGIIFEGPPGNGKTMLAKAIAGEAGVPFISVSGSDFIEMFVGLGAARVRSLWEVALTNAPCILFIDEIDAVGKRRSSGNAADTEGNQTLNALLQKMDGLQGFEGIFVVGATNLKENLDPALLRPGRFDKHLFVGPPQSKKDRDDIISLYLSKKKTEEKLEFDKVSKLMYGFSAAEIESTLNEAVMCSLIRGGDGSINIHDVDEAAMKLRESGIVTSHQSVHDRRIAAVHEAGHALVASYLGYGIAKISIVPYTSGMGGVTILDADDFENMKFKTREDLLDQIKISLAGRMAEILVLGSPTQGCSSDVNAASKIAYTMVNDYAMDNNNLLNIEALQLENSVLMDGKDKLTSANRILVDCNSDVSKILSENMQELLELCGRLISDEVVFDYKHSGQSEHREREVDIHPIISLAESNNRIAE